MKKYNNILVGVVALVVVAGIVLGISGFIAGVRESREELPENTIATAFQEEVVRRALDRGFHPIEGFDAEILLQRFAGLEEQDFNGVQTGAFEQEGVYVYTDMMFEWQRTIDSPITSAERTISPDGYKTLLGNLSERMNMPVRDEGDAIAIVDAIDNTGGADRTVTLYYYNPDMDTDEAGNIMCSAAGLVPVEREMPRTETPIQDTIRLLLGGELTAEEIAEGITTEYPLSGFELAEASLEGSVLTLTFYDPNHATGGGACRVGILWSQIRETALQFNEVREVRFQPEELFQP